MTQRERELLNALAENPMISQQELADKLGITRSSVAVHISHLTKKGYIAGKGYVLRSPSYAVVVGGVNMDIGGRSNAPLVDADSNPGVVRMSLGGVGRNIAHNMALLGCDVRFLTALGSDLYAEKIAASCAELGIDISHALTLPGERTSTYLFLSGPDGDMACVVNDMAIYDRFTPAYLRSKKALLDNAQLIIIDANIPQESIEWLCSSVQVPIFADPVSTAKCGKLKNVLGRLHTLKPNRLEAERLTGVAITDEHSLQKAAQALLDTGLRRVFLSLGSDGIYAADHSGTCRLGCCKANLRNATGAGDAAMAALAWAYLEGTGLEDTVKLTQAASAIAIEGEETINPDMSAEAVRARAGEAFSA